MAGYALLALAGVLVVAAGAAIYRQREPDDVMREHTCAPSGFFAHLKCGRTYAVAQGPDSGEVVVLVPGATLGLWIWRDLPAVLAARGYRVLRYDLLGRGLSQRPRTRYDADLFDEQLAQLLDSQAISRPVHLVGLAFGCLIAAEYARRHPDRVQTVAMLGPDGFGVSMNVGDRIKQLPVIGEVLIRLVGNTRLTERLDGYTSNAEILAWLRAHYGPELRRAGFKRALLSSVRNMPIHDARDLYRSIDRSKMPQMAIWGEADRITPMPGIGQLRGIFEQSEVVALAGVGHLPHVEALAETAETLQRFFNTIDASSRPRT